MKFASIAVLSSCLLGQVMAKPTPSSFTPLPKATEDPSGSKPHGIFRPLKPSEVLGPFEEFKRTFEQYINDQPQVLQRGQNTSHVPGHPKIPDLRNPFDSIDVNKLAQDSGLDHFVKILQPTMEKLGRGDLQQQYDDWKNQAGDLTKTWKGVWEGLFHHGGSASSLAGPTPTPGAIVPTPAV